jgi:hypothetical protein
MRRPRASSSGSTPSASATANIVGFKRLAGRGLDRVDLEKLEKANGELPIEPIPGLDD